MRLALSLLPLAACASAQPLPAASPQAAAPVAARGPYQRLEGHWVGHGSDADGGLEWSIDLGFEAAAKVGAPIGTLDYPGYDCGGFVARAPEDGDHWVVIERLTHGFDRCRSDARMTIDLVDPDTIVVVYVDPATNRVTARARLTRLP